MKCIQHFNRRMNEFLKDKNTRQQQKKAPHKLLASFIASIERDKENSNRLKQWTKKYRTETNKLKDFSFWMILLNQGFRKFSFAGCIIDLSAQFAKCCNQNNYACNIILAANDGSWEWFCCQLLHFCDVKMLPRNGQNEREIDN